MFYYMNISQKLAGEKHCFNGNFHKKSNVVIPPGYIPPDKYGPVHGTKKPAVLPEIPSSPGRPDGLRVMIKHPVHPIIDHDKGDSAGGARPSRYETGIADSTGIP
jgi:hypothetical protein